MLIRDEDDSRSGEEDLRRGRWRGGRQGEGTDNRAVIEKNSSTVTEGEEEDRGDGGGWVRDGGRRGEGWTVSGKIE